MTCYLKHYILTGPAKKLRNQQECQGNVCVCVCLCVCVFQSHPLKLLLSRSETVEKAEAAELFTYVDLQQKILEI